MPILKMSLGEAFKEIDRKKEIREHWLTGTNKIRFQKVVLTKKLLCGVKISNFSNEYLREIEMSSRGPDYLS